MGGESVAFTSTSKGAGEEDLDENTSNLQVIPTTKTDLEEWEHVTTLKTVSLAYEGTRSGLRGYVCVGTNFNYSEDITSRGRVS